MDKKCIWYSEKNAGLLRSDLHNPIKKFIEAGFCFLVAAQEKNWSTALFDVNDGRNRP